jgi:hypothetical protein
MDIANIITELNNHGFTDTADDQKLFVVNDTIWEVEAMEPWPFLEKSIALNTDGTNPYPSNLPSDLKQVKFIADTVVGAGIWPERVETVRDRYALDFLTATATNPQLWYKWGSQVRFYPIPPAATGRFYMDYIATQTKVDSNTLEAALLMPPRHHRVYTLGTLYKLYALEDDLQNASAFQSMYNDKIQLMREDLLRKQYQRPDVVFMTDTDDDPDYLI